MQKKVSIVIPVFNESESILELAEQIESLFRKIAYGYEIIFVDDGSTDSTLMLLNQMSARSPNIFYISFSRNFGHQSALKAGLDHARGDCVISMDGDLQHPPELIREFLQYWEQGFQVVYTRRLNTGEGSFFKRITSKFFYKLLSLISEVEIEQGTADFRLLDRAVVDQLRSFSEDGPFYRGLVKWVGFRQHGIFYTAAPRRAGKTKYTLTKMMQLAIEGATSFNTRPLLLFIYLGFSFSALSVLVYIPYVIYQLVWWNYFPKWASVITLVVFFGGLNLVILGIIGIYIGKVFIQSKSRPHYIVQKTNLL